MAYTPSDLSAPRSAGTKNGGIAIQCHQGVAWETHQQIFLRSPRPQSGCMSAHAPFGDGWLSERLNMSRLAGPSVFLDPRLIVSSKRGRSRGRFRVLKGGGVPPASGARR